MAGREGGIHIEPDFDHRYQYHSPKGDQQERYQAIRAKGKELALLIHECVPDSREKSIANTNLEQALMWANAGIARNE